jgi:outer membrane protein TolC
VDKALEITQKNKELLEKVARIAEERYKVGKGLQQDVLRAQVEVSRVLQRLAVLRQRRRTLEAQLNSLLVRPLDSPIGPLAPVEKSVFAYSLEELLQKSVDNYPEIRRQEQLIEQNQLAVNLARKNYYPDFSVGWDYQNRPDFPEMYGLRFTVNLPVFYKSKQRQAVGEASASLAAAQHEREAIRTALFFQVKEQYLMAKTSEELLNLYFKAIVPQSTLALESGLAAYQVGSLDFLSLITNFTNVLDYEVNYYEELANFQKSLARLEEITGVELTK